MNMRTLKYISSLLCCSAALMACSSEEETIDCEEKVPLEITIGSGTRSIIEGTTIPNQTSFGIYGVDGYGYRAIDNLSVFYDGNCKLSQDVYLGKSYMLIKAYYPYSAEIKDYIANIDIRDQIDFLYGNAVDSYGFPDKIDRSNPKATISFKHALSRITFKVKHTEAYGEDFTLSSLFISPIYLTADYNVYSQTITKRQLNEPTFKIDRTITKDFVSFDLLMIPLDENDHPRWIMFSDKNGSIGNTTIEGEWKAGQQYTYEVTFDDNGIKISEAVITPWETTTLSQIDITDDNLVTK